MNPLVNKRVSWQVAIVTACLTASCVGAEMHREAWGFPCAVVGFVTGKERRSSLAPTTASAFDDRNGGIPG